MDNLMIGSTKTLWTGALFLLLGCSASLAEEQICRFCAEAALMPPGMELEGKYHYAPDRQVDVLHIKLDVTPDFDKHTVQGTASIKAKVIAKPVEVLRLDAVNLNVKSVRCDQANVKDFYSTRSDLHIAFEAPVAPDAEILIQVEYSAEPIQGLYFRTPEMGYPKTDTHIWTQGETHEARHWFPCFDYPNERSSTEVICHVPKSMTVLSNGKRMGEEIDADGLKAVRWFQEKPHANYLICLVAGHLAKLEKTHRDVQLGFYTQPTLAKHAKNSFADTADIMAFFEDEIGVLFPWDKYDQVTIRDFTAGGMENTSLTTLTHGTIFTSATENLRTTRRLDAHEMAHQWFGDYVTCKDWSHLWLNEGFATFYTHLYEGHKFGNDAKLFGLYRDAEGRILSQKNDKKPIVYNAYKNPMEQFDYRSYPKGSWVLHMLRCQLGPDLYRQCIKAYLQKHALTSVVSDDLRQIIEEKSGRPMDRFFDQWLYHARHPDLKITHRWLPKDGLAKVTIRQTQKTDDDVMLFKFPTKLRFVAGDATVDHDILVSKVEEDFYVPLSEKPSIVRFDPDYTVLASVTFDKSDDLLKAQLQNTDDMMGRLLAAKALGSRKTNAAVELLKTVLNEDPFFGVRRSAALSLAKHDSKESYAVLKDAWKQDDARVREVIVEKLMGRFTAETPELIQTILDDEQNPMIRAKALRALGRFHGSDSRKQIVKSLNSNSFRNELAVAAISAIRAQNDPNYKKPLMKVLKKHEARFTSRGFGQGLQALGHVGNLHDKKDDVREFLVSYVNHPKTTVRTSAISALGTLGDAKAISVLQAFTDSPDSGVSRAASQAVGKLRDSKPTAPREVIEFRKQMADMKKANEKLEKEMKEIRELLKAKPLEEKAEKNSEGAGDK